MPPWIFVTPSNRGIGLFLSRLLIRRTSLPIVATTRHDPAATQEAILSSQAAPPSAQEADCVQPQSSFHNEAPRDAESRLTILPIDVTSEDSIRAAAEECKSNFPTKQGHLHLAACIPGILYAEKSPAQLEHDKIKQQFDVNIIGPMLILKHFSQFLPRKSATTLPLPSDTSANVLPTEHATWLNMSARVGSITDNSLGGWYSYRASKAAVNQVTKTFDNFLKTQAGGNALAMAYHPGTVKTGLSREFWGNVKKEKLFSSEYAVEKMMEVVRGRSRDDGGKCWDWKGEEVMP